jgi:hypothetical protein
MTFQLDARGMISNQTLIGETVTLSEEACRGLVDSTLSSGTLRLERRSSRIGIMLVNTSVIDSEVIAVTKQKDDRLFKARFVNCRFKGTFSGIDFGKSHDVERDGDHGGVENCDFTEATLDGCRFFHVEPAAVKLPGWPHVAMVDLSQRADDIEAMTWPGQLGIYMKVCANQPASMRIGVVHVPTLARLVHCSEQQIREAFEQLGGLLM